MIELHHLRAFVSTCHHARLADAAADLRVALSTLSTTLKSLERALGTTLFERANSGFLPTASAHWLYRIAAALLRAEAFGRRSVQASPRHRTGLLHLDVASTFTFGRINTAVNQAIDAMARTHPLVLFDISWVADTGPDLTLQLAKELGVARLGRVEVLATLNRRASGETVLLHDRWALGCRLPVATRHLPPASQILAGTVVVPALQRRLISQLQSYLRTFRISNVRFVSEPPSLLPALFNAPADVAVLAPESLFWPHLGMRHVETVPLDPPLVSTIVARTNPHDAVASAFIERLRSALQGSSDRSRAQAAIGSRSVRYFNMLHRTRKVSSAAQAANITQPAMSEQLHQLEERLKVRLFDRQTDGLIPTSKGDRYAPVAAAIERGLQLIVVSGLSKQRPASERISLGILPSVSQHGYLVNKVAEAVLAVQERHPLMKTVVVEAPNETLQSWVVKGRVGLAIVETGLPNMPRLPLGATERLAAIVDPRHALLEDGSVTLQKLALLPLALPSRLYGLRQLLDAAARKNNLDVSPRFEIDGLAMLIALLGRAPVCTVLPASAVRKEIDRGELVAHSIIEPELFRKLFVIYSADRSLTEAERDLVRTLRQGLLSAQSDK